jgi:sulfide:quinone oxidoreductase
MNRTLKAIDAGANARPSPPETATEEVDYDYIHIIPPQRAPEFVRQSGLSWADKWTDQGWVECDMQTLRHLRYPEIFALGDVAGVPKGKTAASVKWQVPVVEDHIVAGHRGPRGDRDLQRLHLLPADHPGRPRDAGGVRLQQQPVPSFPGMIAPLEELWISWLMKEVALKATYNAMLRGRA